MGCFSASEPRHRASGIVRSSILVTLPAVLPLPVLHWTARYTTPALQFRAAVLSD